jgi:hypothetical protein
MNSTSDHPGYGYMLSKGATSLTEGWNGGGSQDHFMLGHLMEWFYGDLAGIQPDRSAIAFKKIRIKPTPVGDVTSAKANFRSPYGQIESSWKLSGGKFTLDVVIPPSATATVYLPCDQIASITESGLALSKAKGIASVNKNNGDAAVEIESGAYHFEVATGSSSQ